MRKPSNHDSANLSRTHIFYLSSIHSGIDDARIPFRFAQTQRTRIHGQVRTLALNVTTDRFVFPRSRRVSTRSSHAFWICRVPFETAA
jgi:hypothetical protein